MAKILTSTKELFLVEGKSAASTITQVLHKPSQAVHAMQGKLLNVAKASEARVMANQACLNLLEVFGCGSGESCISGRLNYSRIIILTDPDADGAHARALLLAFIERFLQPLLLEEAIYVIIPPLFRISGGSTELTDYAWNEQQLLHFQHTKYADLMTEVTRFKGIAQFSAQECRQLFLNFNTRTSVMVTATEKYSGS